MGQATDPPIYRRLLELLKGAAKEFKGDHALQLGAALSYYTIFSLVPLLFLVVAVAGFVFTDPNVVDDLVTRVIDVAGTEVGDTIEGLLGTVRDQRGGALSVGILLSAFSASGIFQQVQTVLSVVFGVPEEKRREGAVGWLVKRSIALVSAIGLAILVFTPIAAVGAVGGLTTLLPDRLDWLGALLRFVVPVLSVLMLMAVVGLTFQVLTPVVIPWKAAVRGGAFTALIGLGAAFLVGEYLTRAGATGTIGALGGAAILLFFMGLMWTVYLFGAEVTKVYADRLDGDWAGEPSRDPVAARRRTSGREPAPEPSRGTVFAFVAGLAIGLLGRRRRD